MRVGVDARHLAGGRGVAHYTNEMLAALVRGFGEDEWRAFVPGRGALVGGAAAEEGGPAVGGPSAAGGAGGARIVRRRGSSRLLFGSAALLGRPRLDALVGGADVVWVPAPAPVAISPGVPYVLTVHDLAWVERPGDFTAYERLWHRVGRLERLAAGARVAVADSEQTKRAILRHWPSVGDVRVVAPGIPALPPAAPRPPWLPDRYVLAVGALEPRKAPDVLARAFAEARASGLDAELVFAGTGRLAPALRGEGVHLAVGVDRATLAALYEHALALALPSRLEGFGFTPLEAARAGVPVLAADLPVLAETLGDAALRVAPGGWTEALLAIAADDALRERLAAAGREAAARFSWDDAATQLRAILAEAAR